VSIAFNMRLEQISVLQNGWWRLQRTRLSSRILDHPQVPLAFGVDGAAGVANGAMPYYSAPAAGDGGLYGTGRFWFPSQRHDGKLNLAFVGGHVLRVSDFNDPQSAGWKYQPPLN
jgi:prepilin-type processing-associated H-X9-DG protein